MNVAWGLFWGGSWSTRPLVFRCEVAAGGDEGYLVCAVVAAATVSSLNQFLLFVLQCVVVNHVCVFLYMRLLHLWLQIAM